MSTSQVDINKLYRQAEELRDLIRVTKQALGEPVSMFADELEFGMSRMAPKLAVEFQKAIGRGKPEYVIIGGTILGVGWVGAKAIDAVRNKAARKKIDAQLNAYYKELCAKQHRIISMQMQINRELADAINALQAGEVEQKQKIDELQKKQAELSSILSRITTLQQAVTK